MLQVNLKDLFINAHKEAREIVDQVGDYMIAFKIALTDQWKQAKSGKLNENTIKALESDGWSRWTKYGFDRMYFDPEKNGIMKLDCYKSGSISSAMWDNEGISNSEAGRILNARAYINVKNGELTIKNTNLFSHQDDIDMLKAAAQNSLNKAIA